jgi:hypothetical protein
MEEDSKENGEIKIPREGEDSMSQDEDDDEEDKGAEVKLSKTSVTQYADWFIERAKYIPLRLSYKERKHLRLLEAALNVSEYTDKIDILSFRNKGQRIHAELEEICSILLGLVIACDYKYGQSLIQNKSFKDNEEFFQYIFEIGRRHKIMNPGSFLYPFVHCSSFML